MTEPDDSESASMALAGSPTEELPATARLCPYLLADGGWRAAAAASEHRCTALRPPTKLAADKQRRLCLTTDHTGCPTFLAAAEERAGRAAPRAAPVSRPIAMTAPVVIERSRSLLSFESTPGSRRWGQIGLVLLMLVALGAVIVARSGGDGTPPAGGVESVVSSPSATTDGGALATTVPPPATTVPPPATTPGPSDASPSGSAAPSDGPNATSAVTQPPTTAPTASAGTTYTVKRGDTLSSLAVRFGVSVAAIQELNGIADPSLIRVGEVLRIP
jgi:LysM repeat protein